MAAASGTASSFCCWGAAGAGVSSVSMATGSSSTGASGCWAAAGVVSSAEHYIIIKIITK